ncbi:MAG: acyltransferase [Gammaproteobacteria bacterium]|nr:acyltransferase [Gammaproteobacteria bacterium]
MNTVTYRPDIQGLRAIAVLAVMAFHFNPAWLPGGFIGVDVFLVISGFLITSILLNKKAQPDYALPDVLKYFYASRFKRIAPAYFVMLIVVSFAAAVFLLPQDFDTFKDGLTKAAWFNSNNYFAEFGDYFAPINIEQPLLHTWSLAVEMQFYILAPFLILILPSHALKWSLWLLLMGFTLLAEYRLRVLGIEQATYYNLYARLPEFFAGCLAAIYITNNVTSGGGQVLSRLGIGLILVAVIAQPLLGSFPGVAALLPVLGAVLLLVKPSQGLIGYLLSNKALVWIGAISYSLYLWHWPVLALLRYFSGTEVLAINYSLLFILLTLSLSVISYYFVERPFRAKKTAKKQIVGWSLLLFTIFGTSQSLAKVNTVFTPEQLPIEYRRYADPATICHGKIVGNCLQGDLNSDREVLVLGDSHAAMLNHFFDYLGKELGFKAKIITASSCVTIPGFDYQRIPEWAQESCLKQIAEAEKYIDQAKIIFLASAWSYQTQSSEFNTILTDFMSLRKPEQTLLVVSQVPKFKFNLQRVARFKNMGFPAQVEINNEYIEANMRLEKLIPNNKNIKLLRFNDFELFNYAPFMQGVTGKQEMIYFDDHHLNQVGANYYAKEAVKIIQVELQ